MKKLITIFLAILFSTSLISQRSNEIKERISFRNHQKEKYDNKKLFDPFLITNNTYRLNSNSLLNKNGYSEKLDSSLHEIYIDGKWNKDYYKTYEVENNEIFVSTNFYLWKKSKMKFEKTKENYSYDSNARLSINTYIDSVYQAYYKTIYDYNSQGNLLKVTNTFMNYDSSWKIANIIENEYDNNQNLITSSYSYWDWDKDTFVFSIKDQYEYNWNNKRIKYVYSKWNQNKNDWEIESKEEISYYNNESISEVVFSWWIIDSSYWFIDSKDIYTYDSNENMKQILFLNWDNVNKAWKAANEKFEITYDLNTAFSDVLFPSENISLADASFPRDQFGDEKIVMNNKVIGYVYSEWNGGDWVQTEKQTFYYSPFTTSGINKNNTISTNVYPNPANEIVNFDLSNIPLAKEILIFDINGKQIAKYNVTGNNSTINISQLTSGFYTYRIIGTDFISSGKLVKE